MPRLHWPNSDESERTHFTTWWRCNWSSPICRSLPVLGYTSNILFIFFLFLIPVSMSAISCPTELYTQESARSIHSPNLTSSWIVFGFWLAILYSFSCEARSKSLLPHLCSMRSNRFMWDLQNITRSRIMILSINRPEDSGIWKSKDWRLHDTLKSQCFTMSNL